MIIVFGAAGFIGTYLVEQLLKEKYSVIASDISDFGITYYKKRDVPFFKIDIKENNDFSRLPCGDIKTVINLACLQPVNVSKNKYDPVDYININVMGNLNILNFCVKNNIKNMLYTCSHRNTQGLWEEKEGTPIKEDDGYLIKYTGDYSMYSISETTAINCIEYYKQSYGMDTLVFRLPPVYGYGPHFEGFRDGKPQNTGLKIFIDNAINGKPLEVWGDAKKGRDIIYVKDVVTAFMKALGKKDVSGFYNIASGKLLSLEEEAQYILKVFGGISPKSTIVFKPEIPNYIDSYCYDITKAKNELDWTPQYSFEDMMVDLKSEMEDGRFSYLEEKRKEIMADL